MNDHTTPGASLLREIAAEAIPADRDPWPPIRARLAAAPARRVIPRPLRAVGALALLLVVLGLGVPPARAALQVLGVRLLHPVATAPGAGPTAVPPPSAAAARPRGPQRPGTPVTVEIARERAAFPLRLPAWLPPGLHLAHAYLVAPATDDGRGATEVDLIAVPGAGDGWLGLHQSQGPLARQYGVDANYVEDVSVAGRAARYARGTWDHASPTASQSGWDPQADASILTWEEGGVTYVLRANGLGLRQDALVRIAESLR